MSYRNFFSPFRLIFTSTPGNASARSLKTVPRIRKGGILLLCLPVLELSGAGAAGGAVAGASEGAGGGGTGCWAAAKHGKTRATKNRVVIVRHVRGMLRRVGFTSG